MFLAKRLSDGSTVYRSRVTGKRYSIAYGTDGREHAYCNGYPICHTRHHARAIGSIERHDQSLAMAQISQDDLRHTA